MMKNHGSRKLASRGFVFSFPSDKIRIRLKQKHDKIDQNADPEWTMYEQIPSNRSGFGNLYSKNTAKNRRKNQSKHQNGN